MFKEVDYKTYCPKCDHYEKNEDESPCDHCLSRPFREGSHRPAYFKSEDEE